jgi:hypothetical protein
MEMRPPQKVDGESQMGRMLLVRGNDAGDGDLVVEKQDRLGW